MSVASADTEPGEEPNALHSNCLRLRPHCRKALQLMSGAAAMYMHLSWHRKGPFPATSAIAETVLSCKDRLTTVHLLQRAEGLLYMLNIHAVRKALEAGSVSWLLPALHPPPPPPPPPPPAGATSVHLLEITDGLLSMLNVL